MFCDIKMKIKRMGILNFGITFILQNSARGLTNNPERGMLEFG